jgi:hypothetical protein
MDVTKRFTASSLRNDNAGQAPGPVCSVFQR